jgi:hypothetical protein
MSISMRCRRGGRWRGQGQQFQMASAYKWVHHEGGKLFDVAIKDDDTLHNPNGYPEEVVRSAIVAADARRHERRSRAAKQAAVTKAERREKKVYAVVQRLKDGGSIKPGSHCEICGKGLSDQPSRDRGIGSDCWQDIMRFLSGKQRNQMDAYHAQPFLLAFL